MNLSELLNSPIMDGVIKNVAGQFGLDERQAANAISTAVPVMLGKMGKNAQTPDGAQSLDNALSGKHDGSLLDNIFNANPADLQQDGEGILSHVFGDKVENVQSNVARKSGISKDKIGPLLSMVAPVVMGYLGKEKRASNAGAGDLGGLLGTILNSGVANQSSSKGGVIMDMVTGFLDKDHDGSAIDDIFDMFKK